MRFAHFFLVWTLVLLLGACTKDSGPILVYDVKPEFDIRLSQRLSTNSEVQVEIRTLQEYPSGYQIIANLTSENNRFELHIERIEAPQGTPDPGQDTILRRIFELPPLGAGTYGFNVIIRNTIVNEGTLEIDAEQFRLSFVEAYGLSTDHYAVNRIPPQTFWGVAYVDSAYHYNFVNLFFNELQAFAQPVQNPRHGDYGYFVIGSNGEISLPFAPAQNSKSFYLQSDDPAYTIKIDSLLQYYKGLNVGFHGMVITTNGHIFFRQDTDNEPFLMWYREHFP